MIRYLLPNILTGANIILGTTGIFFVFTYRIELACLFIVMGALLDFLDGLIARGTGASSSFGKELDSLADMVIFGVLPAIILIRIAPETPLRYICALPALSAGVRLALFNIKGSGKKYFLGMPTPASALTVAFLVFSISLETGINLYAGEHILDALKETPWKMHFPRPEYLLMASRIPHVIPLFAIVLAALNVVPLYFIKAGPHLFSRQLRTIIIIHLFICLLLALFLAGYYGLTYSVLFYTMLYYIIASLVSGKRIARVIEKEEGAPSFF